MSPWLSVKARATVVDGGGRRLVGDEAHAQFRGDELRGAGMRGHDVDHAVEIAFAEAGGDVLPEHLLGAVVVRFLAEDDFARGP